MKSLYDFICLPEAILPALNAPSLIRLTQIDMNCGLNYTQFPLFTITRPYSRYEHSVGVAKLLTYFQRDEAEILSGLFHDIATPVFSHVADFMNHDHLKQESTEEPTERMIGKCQRNGWRLKLQFDFSQFILVYDQIFKYLPDEIRFIKLKIDQISKRIFQPVTGQLRAVVIRNRILMIVADITGC